VLSCLYDSLLGRRINRIEQRSIIQGEPCLQDKLDRKLKIVAAIALANKMARQIWAMITKNEIYKLQKVIAS